MNKTINNKMSKTVERKSLGVSEFMVEYNIKSETELFAIADEQKNAGKKILQILFYLTQQKHQVTFLKTLEDEVC